jgi:3-methyladenine DNA glycosylase/8-oxoguanine DNA glycosylase
MFLIFTLNRPDVLPTGDLGIKKGFQIVYNLKKTSGKEADGTTGGAMARACERCFVVPLACRR